MINLEILDKCTCKKYNSIPKECKGQYTYRDSAKQVKLTPKNDEKCILISIDDCFIKDKNSRKCDCLFIYIKSESKKYSFLTELKGKNHIKSAFEQLAITKENSKYQNILKYYKIDKKSQKYVIVSDIQINKIDLRRLEKDYKIRVGALLHSDPQSKVPDLKTKIKDV